MKARILVVQESPAEGEALRLQLEKSGYDVTLAHDGEEAWALFQERGFDLVASDVVMSKNMDGYELCRRIKAVEGPDSPVILLTSLSEPLDIIRGLEVKADNFLTKPYDAARLRDRIESLIYSHRARREERVDVGVSLHFLGRQFTIDSRREQMLDMLVGSFEDVVQRKEVLERREEELREAQSRLSRYAKTLEGRLDSVLSSVPDVLFSVSPDWESWHYVSAACLQVMGCRPEDLSREYLSSRLRSDDFDRLMAISGPAAGSPGSRSMELPFEGPPGDTQWLSWTLVPVEGAGAAPTRIDGIVRDITEQKHAESALHASEERFKMLFYRTPVGKSITIRGEGRFVEVNARFEEMSGYTREELIGHTVEDLDFWHNPKERDVVTEQAEWAGGVHGREVEIRRADGEVRVWLLWSHTIDIDGVPHLLSVVDDTTERRRMAMEHRQAQKMEAIGQLTGGMAHDFNNLLTVISSNADLLAKALPGGTPDQLQEVQEIRDAASRGTEMVRKLLASSRQGDTETGPVDLPEAVRNARATLHHLLPDNVEVVAPPAEPLAVEANAGAVQQILLNLATNARDAMPEGGTLTLGVRPVVLDEQDCATRGWGIPGTYGCVEVRDNGTGMDRPTQARVFERFFTTKPPGLGTGLGMAMVYGLVVQQRGFIHVYSEPGVGTSVRIYLPTTESSPEAAALLPDHSGAAVKGGKEMILVVEDEEAIRRVARRALEALGYRVLVAADGEDALRALAAQTPRVDLVVSDVSMPRMDGPGLFRAARAMGSRSRFLFTSGYTRDDMDDSRMEGVDAPFLSKPWTVAELLGRVREVLDQEVA